MKSAENNFLCPQIVKTALQNRQNDHMFDLKSPISGSWINLLAENKTKIWTFASKKQTFLKHEKKLRKSAGNDFLLQKLSKMTPQNRKNEQIFDQQFKFFEVIYQPLELK